MRNMVSRLYTRCKKYGSAGMAMMIAVLFTMPAYASSGGGDGMSSITGSFTSMLTWAISGMTSVVAFIVSTPLIMSVVGLFFVGFIISLFVRIFHSV